MIQTVNVNVAAQPTSGGPESFLMLSQNENGRQIRFRILGDDLPAGCTATFSGTKPDGTVYSASGTIDGNFVLLDEEIQMTAVSGRWDAKLSIAKGTENIMTSLIRVTVVADAVSGDSIPSDSELDGIVAECRSYAEAAKNEAYGSPLTASTAAAMTDQSRVYVYTGSESGMTAGHWYYYNGSAWADGGVYNAVAVDTDTTLAIAGKAADAKATGDAVAELKEDLSELDDRVAELEAGGVSEALKTALLQLAQKVAYIDDDGQTYYDDLYDALYPPATLVSIDAVYTQSGTVYESDTLDSLKTDLVVTGTYSDATSRTITDYTLSGTLVEGTSTITVSYNGKTDTFNVTVSASASYVQNGLLYRWVAEDSDGSTWTDRKSNAVINLTNVTKSGNALVFNGTNSSGLGLTNNAPIGSKTIEVVYLPSGARNYTVISAPDATVSAGSTKKLIVSYNEALPNNFNDYTLPTLDSILYNAVTYNGNFEQTGYVSYLNGNVETPASASKSSYNYNKTGGIEIGATFTENGTPNSYFMNGKIYEIRIYNRALTAEEIANNYGIDVAAYGIGA